MLGDTQLARGEFSAAAAAAGSADSLARTGGHLSVRAKRRRCGPDPVRDGMTLVEALALARSSLELAREAERAASAVLEALSAAGFA